MTWLWSDEVRFERAGRETTIGRLRVREATGPSGRTLADWVAQEGWTLRLPDFREHPVSLERWRNHDPETTRLEVEIIHISERLYLKELAAGRDPFASIVDT